MAEPGFECKLFDFRSNIPFVLAVLGLHCCAGFFFFFLAAASGGYSQVAVCRLLIAMASRVAEHRLQVLQ